MNAHDLFGGQWQEDWDSFGYIHTIFMYVFHDVERPSEYANKTPPFTGNIYCLTFTSEYEPLIATIDAAERYDFICKTPRG